MHPSGGVGMDFPQSTKKVGSSAHEKCVQRTFSMNTKKSGSLTLQTFLLNWGVDCQVSETITKFVSVDVETTKHFFGWLD